MFLDICNKTDFLLFSYNSSFLCLDAKKNKMDKEIGDSSL